MMRLSGNLRRYRWGVFAAWLLVLVPAVLVSLHQSNNLTGGGFEVSGSQSLRVQRQVEDHYPGQGASPLALVAAPRPGASVEDMTAAVSLLEQKATDVPSVSVAPNPTQPPPSPDRPYVVSLKLDFHNSGAVDVAKQLRSKVGISGDKPGRLENGKVDLYVIGQGALGAAAQSKTKHDIAEAERWNLPIILIVLLAVFGSLAAAAIPLLLGVVTVAISMGLIYLLSTVTTMSVFVTPTVSMFGIALAVDYSLFILMRYREELRAGRDAQQATDAAMSTSGLAVVLSGLTVIASIAGIYLINTPVLRSMATGALLTVAVAVLTSATLIPAVLATFGRAAAKRSWLLHWSRRPESTQSPFWTRWVGLVMRRPWAFALVASVLLLTLAAPALSMTLSNSMQRQFAPDHEVRGGVNAAAQALGPGALGPIRVLVTFPDGTASSPQAQQLIDAAGQQMREAPHIVTVQPAVLADDGDSALLSAVLAIDPEDMSARDTVDWMRERLPQLPGAGNVRFDVGGPTALIKDFDDRVEQTQPWVFLFVSAIAFVMLLISIRSVFLAFKGVLMTVLSVAAAYGSIVMVFQWGWLKALGFQPISSLDSSVPPLVLAITFGLSMDYEIFLLTRIRERFLQTNNTRDAVTWGVSTSARTITSAALIMIAVYVGFAFAGMPLVAEIGVACAVAIAVDATVVRLVLVPALMAMFAQWNWWLPDWLHKILPSVDFERPLPKVDIGDVVVIPDDISSLVAPNSDVRMVVKSAAKLKDLAPDAICVADPLAFSGCGRREEEPTAARNVHTAQLPPRASWPDSLRASGPPQGRRAPISALRHRGSRRKVPWAGRGVHPVTMWRGRLSVVLDALAVDAQTETPVARRSPVETTNVQLPTGDRLQIPTGAETLRMKGYLLMCRNSSRDYAEFAELVDTMDPTTAALVLAGMDKYYCGQQPRKQWVATQLVRRLADPQPSDEEIEPDVDWEEVKQRCLSVAVAMLEEAR
ncbi:MAG: MMPL family transporter [Mycobacterium sp.]